MRTAYYPERLPPPPTGRPAGLTSPIARAQALAAWTPDRHDPPSHDPPSYPASWHGPPRVGAPPLAGHAMTPGSLMTCPPGTTLQAFTHQDGHVTWQCVEVPPLPDPWTYTPPHAPSLYPGHHTARAHAAALGAPDEHHARVGAPGHGGHGGGWHGRGWGGWGSWGNWPAYSYAYPQAPAPQCAYDQASQRWVCWVWDPARGGWVRVG